MAGFVNKDSAPGVIFILVLALYCPFFLWDRVSPWCLNWNQMGVILFQAFLNGRFGDYPLAKDDKGLLG